MDVDLQSENRKRWAIFALCCTVGLARCVGKPR
jgi:hypothetical protein